jgi:ArsR family transcriptional regulator
MFDFALWRLDYVLVVKRFANAVRGSHYVRMSSVANEMIRLHAHVCKGLADPKRLLIIDALRHGEVTVTELVDALEIPQANVSQHLAVLRDKGLVSSRRDGQWAYYSLTSPKIIQAVDLLRQVMHEQLDHTDA